MIRRGRVIATQPGTGIASEHGICPETESIVDRRETSDREAAIAQVALQGVACSRCRRGQGCGALALSNGDHRVVVLARDPIGVCVGDEVQIDIDDQDAVWLAPVLCAYALPTAGLLLGAWLPHARPELLPDPALWIRELVSVCLAVAGLIGGVLAWQKLIQPRLTWRAAGLCLDSVRIHGVCLAASRKQSTDGDPTCCKP